ncbi:hypothetical protein PIB30_091282 [Stylosanthes scabra]|uniref:Uncharacterized protein n=1 Tax=Stylosanthes scabra TaxID=79078 RepID=A0ABU6XTV5_9FABA|nr:hypothetical protein [Stylosanthes scabra]
MEAKEFHIYVEHVVDIPILVEEPMIVEEEPVIVEEEPVIFDDLPSNDSYESVEDEAYKPPPAGYEEDDSDFDPDMLKKKKKKKKKKSLRKKSPKKCSKKALSPRHKKGVNEARPSKGGRPQLSPNAAKKRQAKKYTGARRRHVLRDGNNGVDHGFGQNSRPGPDLGKGLGGHSNGRTARDGERAATNENVNGPSVDTNTIEEDSDYEWPYVYESKAFNSPVSSEDEGRTTYDAFNEETEYGEVEFKVGQLFECKAQFMKALSDYFVYEENSKLKCFQVKTLYNGHSCGRDQHGNGSQNMGQCVNSQSSIIIDFQAPQRMKQPIIKPQVPPTTTPSAGNSAAGLPVTQIPISNGPRVSSAETMAATSSGTAARLFRYMPTPGFKPPRQK